MLESFHLEPDCYFGYVVLSAISGAHLYHLPLCSAHPEKQDFNLAISNYYEHTCFMYGVPYRTGTVEHWN